MSSLYYEASKVNGCENFKEQAARFAEIACSQDPSDLRATYLHGLSLAAVGRTSEAFHRYRECVDGGMDAINRGCGTQDTQEHVNRLGEFCVKSASDAWCMIANLYRKQKQVHDAVQAYVCSIRMDSSNFTSWLNIGQVYEALGEIEDALYAYGNACAIQSNDELSARMVMLTSLSHACQSGVISDQDLNRIMPDRAMNCTLQKLRDILPPFDHLKYKSENSHNSKLDRQMRCLKGGGEGVTFTSDDIRSVDVPDEESNFDLPWPVLRKHERLECWKSFNPMPVYIVLPRINCPFESRLYLPMPLHNPPKIRLKTLTIECPLWNSGEDDDNGFMFIPDSSLNHPATLYSEFCTHFDVATTYFTPVGLLSCIPKNFSLFMTTRELRPYENSSWMKVETELVPITFSDFINLQMESSKDNNGIVKPASAVVPIPSNSAQYAEVTERIPFHFAADMSVGFSFQHFKTQKHGG
ncbi:hypothetical protein ACOME3_007503 [Neoechinorhynchus agilis]